MDQCVLGANHTFLDCEWLQNVYAFVIICLVFPSFACVLGQYQRYHTPSRLFRDSFYAVLFVVYMFGVFLLRQAWAMSSGSYPNCMTFRVCSICVFYIMFAIWFYILNLYLLICRSFKIINAVS